VISQIVAFLHNYILSHSIQGGHSPGEPGKVREFKSGQGKCVLAYGQLLRVLILTQNVQKKELFTGTVVHHMKSERRKGFSYMQVVT